MWHNIVMHSGLDLYYWYPPEARAYTEYPIITINYCLIGEI